MSARRLHLTITTPDRILADRNDVDSLRAEDESGGFGILPGHADFLTVLGASVLRWRDAAGGVHFCAIRAGVLRVRAGTEVAIACREGALGDDLEKLESDVQTARAAQIDAARRAQVEQTRLHARAVRELMRHLRAQPGAPTTDLTPDDGGLS